MRIEINATNMLTKLDGVDCRVWEGVTAHGLKCQVFVHRIAVHKDENQAEFEEHLLEQMPPGVQVDLRQVL